MSPFGLRAGSYDTKQLSPVLNQIWCIYEELTKTQFLPAEQIERHQLAHIRRLLAHCLNYVPYYSEILHSAGIHPNQITTLDDFRRIPELSRRVCRERSSELKATHLPPSVEVIGQATTSGTSGIPLMVNCSYVISALQGKFGECHWTR